MKTNWTCALLSSILLAVPLSACGTDSEPAAAGSSPEAAGGKTTVTVSVLNSDAFLQNAERLFEEAHPNIDIEIRAYTVTPASNTRMMNKTPGAEPDNSADIEKFRTGVNTELMSGKGSDLIALEHLPYAKYADKKLLAPLDPWISKGLNPQEYYTGVFDALKLEGKSYALPVHFKSSLTLGNGPLLEGKGVKVDDASWTWQQMMELGQSLVQSGAATAIWTGVKQANLLTDMVESEYGSLVQGKKAAFNTPRFISLLEMVRGMYEQGLILEQAAMSNDSKDLFRSAELGSATELLTLPQMAYGGKAQIYNTPSDGSRNGGFAFSSDLLFGMNEKSKHKDEAWQFLQFLLSETVQTLPAIEGIPVHKASLDVQLRKTIEQLSSGRLKLRGPNGAAPSTAVSEEQLKEMVTLMERANRYAAGDPNVMKIVKEELATFVNEGKTAQATASMIQNRVETYLNE